MTIKTNLLMITAAAFITGTAAFAQDTTPPAPTTPDVQFLLDLFSGDVAPSVADVNAAITAAGYTANRIEIDEDGEVKIRFTTADGVQYRFRLDEGETRFGQSDDVAGEDTSDMNGEDTSDTSDSNDDSSDDNDDDSSDDNGGSSGGGNSGSGGGSED